MEKTKIITKNSRKTKNVWIRTKKKKVIANEEKIRRK